MYCRVLRQLATAAAAFAAVVMPVHAQQATLTPRGPHTYGAITDVRELSTGQLILSDTEGGTLWLVNADGARTNAVKSGSIQAPGRLRTLRGDTTIVFSRANTQFMLLTPDGKLGAASASLTPPPGPMRFGASRDMYFTNDGQTLVWSELVRGSESMPLMRRTAAGTSATIATLRLAPSRQGGEGGITYSIPVPFSPIDDWDLLDNGDVVIARGNPYRVDRVARDGRVITGTPREFTAVPITAEDREKLKQEQQRSLGAINVGGSIMTATIPADAWPTYKSPFGRSALRAAPDGSAWVKRHVAFNATTTLYDVFNSDGTFREAMTLPADSEIVGFGTGVAFVSVRSGDTFQLYTVATR